MLELGDGGMRILATDLIEPAYTLNPPRTARNDAAIIQYSSGSSGEPRGVLISHRNLLSNSEAIKRAFQHDRDCVGVSWLPHFHDMGLVGGVLQPLYVGFEISLMAPSDFIQQPLRWLEAISRFRATTSGAPTFGYKYCCRRFRSGTAENICLDSWRVAFCGSEPVNAEVLRAFGEQFSVNGFSRNAFVPCYGLAEATLLVTSKLALETCIAQSVLIEKPDHLPSEELAAPGLTRHLQLSVGREIVNCGSPALDTAIVIASLSADSTAESGVAGEICVSGPGVGTCYWRNPMESRSTFHNKFQKQEGKRYLRTGDLGFLIHGELHVTGRLKE
jgi:acyl-CoA synthetase (AMP-forming)/AMP-acid ligase II